MSPPTTFGSFASDTAGALVLLASASPLSRTPAEAFLRADRHPVLCADSAAETLRLTTESHPPLVLIDHTPPAIDGAGLCGALRKTEAGAAAYGPLSRKAARSSTEGFR
jgi:CheY-like chemotaxis protein